MYMFMEVEIIIDNVTYESKNQDNGTFDSTNIYMKQKYRQQSTDNETFDSRNIDSWTYMKQKHRQQNIDNKTFNSRHRQFIKVGVQTTRHSTVGIQTDK